MRKKRNIIYGITFRPGSMSQADNEANMHSSDYSVSSDFMDHYRKHIGGMQVVAECAKIFILKNYTNVKDWSNLNVIINDNSGEPTEYFNYIAKKEKKEARREEKLKDGFKRPKEIRSEILNSILDRMDNEDQLKHNPVISLTDVVLDTTDGDFSVTINDKSHNWIDDSSIIIIASYIEKQLK